MGTAIKFLYSYVGVTDSKARHNWLQMENVLGELGLVKEAVTGQADPATVTGNTGTSGNVYTGQSGSWLPSQIWGFNDALQAVAPVFIKAKLGQGSGGTYVPWFGVRVGTQSQNITNANTGVTGLSTSEFTSIGRAMGDSQDVTYPCYFSGSSSRFAMALFPYHGQLTGFYSVERTKDEDGNDTAEGVIVTTTTVAGGAWTDTMWTTQQIDFTNAVVRGSTGKLPCLALASQSLNDGNSLRFFPIYPENLVHQRPLRDTLVYNYNNINSLVPINVNHYGSEKPFLPLGVGFQWASPMVAASSILMRWE